MLRTVSLFVATAGSLSACNGESGPRPAQVENEGDVVTVEKEKAAGTDASLLSTELPPDSERELIRAEKITVPFGTIRIRQMDTPGGIHSEPSRLNVTYFDQEGDVVLDDPEAVLSGSWGSMDRWSIRHDIGDFPVIEAVGGGTWQGYTCSWTSLTELAPSGPRELLQYLDYYSSVDGYRSADLEEYKAEMLPPDQNGTLMIRYSGTRDQTNTYRRTGNAYERVSGEELEGC